MSTVGNRASPPGHGDDSTARQSVTREGSLHGESLWTSSLTADLVVDFEDPALNAPAMDSAAASNTRDSLAIARLPAGPGVMVFEDAHGRALMIASTANLRELAKRRLVAPTHLELSSGAIGPAAPGEAGKTRRNRLPSDSAPSSAPSVHAVGAGQRAEYRSIVRRVLAFEAGGSLEIDALYLALARERLPVAYRTVIERWRSWWVSVDVLAPHPQLLKTNLMTAMPARSAGARQRDDARDRRVDARSSTSSKSPFLIGPVPNKDAAGRLIERMIDGFDLCRFHHLLVQAPVAHACAYKDMGRCPAPCDGSESLVDYRTRVQHMTDCFSGRQDVRSRASFALTAAMSDAARAGEFELAARLKRGVELASDPKYAHVCVLHELAGVLVMPGVRAGWARLFGLVAGVLKPISDVSEKISDSRGHLAELAEALPGGCPMRDLVDVSMEGLDEREIATLACVSRWFHQPSKRRRGVVLSLQEAQNPTLLGNAIKAVTRRPRHAGEAVEDDLIESMG